LTIAYDGTNYYGFQRQKDKPSVQGTLENAISKITKEVIKTKGASRIDRGGHALGQVVCFETCSSIPCLNLKDGINSILPKDIFVRRVTEVDTSFNPRHALIRKYRYIVQNQKEKCLYLSRYSYFFPYELDISAMEDTSTVFIGTHNFSSFAMCEGRNPTREIKDISIVKNQGIFGESLIFFDISGASFLTNMIRSIVATLLKVGQGILKKENIIDIFNMRKRVSWKAPANGLFLLEVVY